MRSEDRNRSLRLAQEVPAEGLFLFDQFRQFQYQHELAMLHLTGYLEGRYLRFDGGMGEDTMDPVGFADVLGRLPGLKMIFLNGCGHRELVEQLLLRDIPAVISINTEGPNRKLPREIAKKMYESLLAGCSIRQSWLEVQEAFAGKLVYRKAYYDLESDTLTWKDRDPNRPEVDWGLYVLEDNEQKLDWTLPAASGAEALALKTPAPVATAPASRKWLFWGSSAVMLAIFVALMFVFDIPQRAQSLFQAEAPCVFLNDDTYNILQLPLHPPGQCRDSDPVIADAVRRRLEQLADAEDGEDDFQVKSIPGPCPMDIGQAEDLIRTCQADLVLWGEYLRDQGEVLLKFEYLYRTQEVSLDRGNMSVRLPESQLDVDNDFIVSGIEEVVYWARGSAHLSRYEHEEALHFFSKIREQNTANYLRVDVRMAQAYIAMEMYEKALARYDHMLQIEPDNEVIFNDRGHLLFQMQDFEAALNDFEQAILLRPDYADALYNRGLVYMQLSNFPDAISDIQTVIRLQPQDPRPYAALAAVYAELGEEEKLYANLERALERGFEIERLLSYYTAFRRYKMEARFQELVEKHR